MNESKKLIIRNTAVVFLLVILLLTFFSKTINNYLLPEVQVRPASRGNLENETKASGEVKLLHTSKIFSPGNLSINEVHVKEGENVSKGAILLTVDASRAQLEIQSREFELLRLKNDLAAYKENFKPIVIADYEEEIARASKTLENEKQNLEIIKSIYSEDVKAHIEAASKNVENAKKDLSNKEKLLESKKLEADKAQKEYDRTVKEMKLAVAVKDMELSQFMDNPPNVSYDQMTLLLNQLELEVQKLKNQLENYKANYTPIDLSLYESDITAAKEAVNKEENNLKQVIETYEQNSENRLRLFNAQISLENAEVALSQKQEQLLKKQEEAGIEQNGFNRTVEQKEAEIRLKALEITTMKKDIPADGRILSPYEGLIKTVNIENGQTSTNQQVLFEVVKKDTALSVQWMMNPAQAELLKAGDKVSLKIKGEGALTIDARVDDKKFSSQDGMYLFSSELSPEEYPLKDGQEAEITALKTSETYDLIVPTSCLSKQNGLEYLFILRERQGALGLENYVEQVNITSLESDDLNTAITGNIKPDDQLVILSSKPLYNNAQVKLR